MIFTVQIKVMPLKDLLDPQGKAVMGGLQNLGLNNISDVRIGKHIDLQIEAGTKETGAALRKLAECKATDKWPSYSDEVELISLPPWMLPKADGDGCALPSIEMY